MRYDSDIGYVTIEYLINYNRYYTALY